MIDEKDERVLSEKETRKGGDESEYALAKKRERNRKYREENRERLIAQQKEWYKKNAEKQREKSLKRYYENRDLELLRRKKYAFAHYEEIKKYHKEYRELKKAYFKEYAKNYYQKHKEEMLEKNKKYYEKRKAEKCNAKNSKNVHTAARCSFPNENEMDFS